MHFKLIVGNKVIKGLQVKQTEGGYSFTRLISLSTVSSCSGEDLLSRVKALANTMAPN